MASDIHSVTCRRVAREQVGKHVSMEMDSWKPARHYLVHRRVHGYRIPVTNRRFHGHGYAILEEKIDQNGAIPCGGAVEYLHRSPASRKSRRKGSPVPWGITGPPCSCGI
jgi:hypothetical protein